MIFNPSDTFTPYPTVFNLSAPYVLDDLAIMQLDQSP